MSKIIDKKHTQNVTFDTLSSAKELLEFDAAILENEYLKATFVTELGGRLWSLYDKKEERELGLSAGLSLLWFCDELWVFGDKISQGMQKEIKFCENLNIPIKYIKLNTVYRKLGVLKYEKEN
mgnify:CR=1 FL=1